MNNQMIEEIVKCMPPNEYDPTIQSLQTEHRLKLVNFWDIKVGSKVLEIGCGQGDTTAVLAYIVGDEGFVYGIDIASPNYGSPVTLGDSINFLKNSSIGNRIKVDFEVNILSSKVSFPENAFDYIVLSHCSWYLKSPKELHDILKKIKKWGNTLCFAEWDTRVQTNEQLPHFLSVLIQAQYECFKESSLSNVRTLFTPKDIQSIAESAGWQIEAEKTTDSSQLQDGKWEIENTLASYEEVLQAANHLPHKFQALIQSEIYLLEAASSQGNVKSMSTYTFLAK
ncbi:class I SAM-dependent methyltransferase [Psychrobacillus sp. L4]|uniref:class I SAM-dependent methyltransferase n=1 Tax=Psychrobacillus sp. L4 TaxID=3236892 RepID=UPI0036F2E988